MTHTQGSLQHPQGPRTHCLTRWPISVLESSGWWTFLPSAESKAVSVGPSLDSCCVLQNHRKCKSELHSMWKVQIFEGSWHTPFEISPFRQLESLLCDRPLSLELSLTHHFLSSGRMRSKKPEDSMSQQETHRKFHIFCYGGESPCLWHQNSWRWWLMGAGSGY